MVKSLKKDMTQGAIGRTILLFALPIMAANLLQQLYNTVDNIIVGNFAEAAMPGSFAAVSTTSSLTFLFLSFSIGMGMGASIVCSQLYGARRERDLNIAVDTAMLLLGAIGIIMMIVCWVVTPAFLAGILRVTDPDIMRYAISYMRIYCIGLPFQFVYNAIASSLRGVGDSKASLIFLLITSVTNVALDLWFVMGFGWGVAGAAAATVISQFICVTCSYIYLRRRFPFANAEKHFDKTLCLTIFKIGLPTSIQMAIVSFGNVLMMRIVHYFSSVHVYGNAIVDAFGGGTRVDFFANVPIMGLQSALASFTGQNLAANNIKRINRGYFITLAIGLVVTACMCTTMYVFSDSILQVFGLSSTAVSIGSEMIRYYAKAFVIFMFYTITCGVIQGSGDTIYNSIATLSSLAMRIAIAYLGVFVFDWFSYEGAWVPMAYGWVLATTMILIRYFTGGWKKKAIARRAPEEPSGDLLTEPPVTLSLEEGED